MSNVPGRRKRGSDGEFVEALARGLQVITAFGPTAMELTVSQVATITSLARPTARRLLLTLEQLGYVRSIDNRFMLTTKTLELGTAVIAAQRLWDVAQPHQEALVAQTHESSSLSQLEGSDIVYTGRVAVPKIIALAVHIGTLFPAVATSMGHVMLADLSADELDAVVATPSRSGIIPRVVPTSKELDTALQSVREQGWALSDERLSIGVRSVAAPVRNGAGEVVAAMNVTVHAAETSIETLTGKYLPLLLETTEKVSEEWANLDRVPIVHAELDDS